MCVWRGGLEDSEENILTNPFKAPCIFLAQEPAAFTQLSVSRHWSLSETSHEGNASFFSTVAPQRS